MSNILFTYSGANEIRYLNDKRYLMVYNLNNTFNYGEYDYIDITFAIEYLYHNPQDKIHFQILEDYLNVDCVAVINKRQAEIALNMFPILF